jgi:ABC-type transport system involved in cytochrome bd biosynthesis fused ATPase/permease subunit
MSQTVRRFSALVILVLLVVVPFIDWKLGAVLWMCAWLVFIFQNLFTKQKWKFGKENNDEDEESE